MKHAPPIPELGQRLRRARQRAGLTLKDAEPIVRIHFVDLCKYEVGEHTPGLKTLLKLCRAYQTSPNELLGWPKSLNKEKAVGKKKLVK